MNDLRTVAKILKGKTIAPGRILKIVPATDKIWQQCLDEGIIKIFKDAGVLIGSAGCAGCAAGQIGQTGTKEVTISSGNRNFLGKQGKGDIYLSSPATVAASLVAGFITSIDSVPASPIPVARTISTLKTQESDRYRISTTTRAQGKAWVIKVDNIDTDMIFHNRYLSITDIQEMGQYTFGNLSGYEEFAKKVKKGDIIVTGKNFGCGSSRQQAVDCFKSLEVGAILAESFGSIYERNAINSALPILIAPHITSDISHNDILVVDFQTGEIHDKTKKNVYHAKPFSKSQLDIYKRGGLLKK
jgi:3-isopropylmalate dehydratase small subunit